jgi:4-aminobutyrate aminotransferase-like enzyme
MVGCEFTNPETDQPDDALTKKVVGHALNEGHLLLLTCGMYGNTIRWIPPLVVTAAQINEALEKFERAVAAAAK